MRMRLWVIGTAMLLAALLILAALYLIPLQLTDSRVQQAVVAGLVIAVGWLASFALREISAQLGRLERLRDVHRAIYAEIRHNLENLESVGALQDYGMAMLARIREADGFVPFIPRERNDTVFRTVVSDIHILPRVTIDPIVQYYSQLAALDALSDDMRGEDFALMTPRRRADLYADYINIKISLVEYGQEATRVIDAYANRSRRAAATIAAQIRADRAARKESATDQ